MLNQKISSKSHLFTSESVSEGHPDKLADRISDAILDRFLENDPHAKVASETLVTGKLVVLAGEFHTHPPGIAKTILREIPALVRNVIRDTGYTGDFPGIDPHSCDIQVHLSQQSQDIRMGVEQAEGKVGAGDQGHMFGFACDETPELMPLPISLAHRLVMQQAELRKTGVIPWVRPDAKSQVSIRYKDESPEAVEAVVLSTQHSDDVDIEIIREVVEREIIREVIPEHLLSPDVKIYINPTGRFVIGGPQGDAGLTGRKIIVDTYGGRCPHGGGAFSGKDPSKVDRSAAYAARHVAKNIVAAGVARKCTIQISYAIGVAKPVSLMVDTHGTGSVSDVEIEHCVNEIFDLSPQGIITSLDLLRPIFAQTAIYGHFGREGFSWEKMDKVGDILTALHRKKSEERNT